MLLGFGVVAGLIETGLFYFDFLTKEVNGVGTLIVFALCFCIAFIPATEKAKDN